MQSLRRGASVAARQTRTTLSRQTRRHAHEDHSHGHHSTPQNEPLGKGFYITISALPLSFALYKAAGTNNPDSKPWFTRFVDSYSYYVDRWAARNDLHTKALQQAGSDRLLFISSKPSTTVDMKFPEIFNTGSPWNVSAGQGGANLDSLIAHYEKKNFEEQRKQLEQLREGSLPAEQEPKRITKIPPFP